MSEEPVKVIHPALSYSYDILYALLLQEVENGYVARQTTEDGLELFCYTKKTVFEQNWNPITRIARGLILDTVSKEIVALPFVKFHNIGESAAPSIPNLPFEVYEKLDGSLIIAFWHRGEWKTATKGSFESDQAVWAKAQLRKYEAKTVPGVTYLFEAIYPENRIVISYDYEGIVLLGAYLKGGVEANSLNLDLISVALSCRAARRYAFDSISYLLSRAETLSPDEEGWVLRFSDGTRLKIKGAEYRRIHAAVSNLTPLTVWNAMRDNEDMDEMKSNLPEEFWDDFDSLRTLLQEKYDSFMASILCWHDETKSLSDKELGIYIQSNPKTLSLRFLFPFRKAKSAAEFEKSSSRKHIFDLFRPTANRLEGYRPSFAVSRVQNDDS